MIATFHELLATEQPLFLLIAGPNGGGKSTFRQKYLDPIGIPCIDPDEVARSLFGRSPINDDESIAASAEASRSVRKRLQDGESFALESVFSDRQGLKLGLLREARQLGYRVGVIFIGVDDPQLSIMRVSDRVRQLGHDVPDERIRDRFPRSFENLKRAIPLSDFVLLVDNGGEQRHRIFGAITIENGVGIWDATPRWYHDFEIGK